MCLAAQAKGFADYLAAERGRGRSAADRDDLRGAAYLGLVLAARRFDPSRGVPFPSFAAVRITGEMSEWQRGGRRRRTERFASLPAGHAAKAEYTGTAAREALALALAGLSGRERFVLLLRYGVGLTWAETAAAAGYGLSGAQAVHRAALRKVRARLPGAFPAEHCRPLKRRKPGPACDPFRACVVYQSRRARERAA